MESKINSKIRMFLGLFATASIIIPQALLFAQEQDQVKKALFQHITEKIEQAKKRDIATLAPTLFGEMMQLYRQAERYYEKGERLAKIRSSLNETQEKLKQAIETSKISAVALAKVLETRKQASQFEFIRKVAPKKFAKAERNFQQAIGKAESGDIRGARKKANDAIKNYRAAALQAVKIGPMNELTTEFKKSKKKLSRERLGKASRELAELKSTMNKAKKQEFEISEWVARVKSKIEEAKNMFLAVHFYTPSAKYPTIIPGVGDIGQGAGAAITYLDDNPKPDMVLMAYESPLPAGANSFHYKIGWNLDTGGNSRAWGQSITVEGFGFGLSGHGAGMAITNLDGNVRPDMIVMAYDNGEFNYKIGWNLGSGGKALNWSNGKTVAGVSGKVQGAGVALTNLDADSRPEMVLMAYRKLSEEYKFLYKIGWNLNVQGETSNWSSSIIVPNFQGEAQGAGVASAELNGNDRPEIILMVYGYDPGETVLPGMLYKGKTGEGGLPPPSGIPSGSVVQYTIGWDLNASGTTGRWDPITRDAALRDREIQGADMIAFDLDGNDSQDYVFVLYERTEDGNQFRYWSRGASRNYVLTTETCRPASEKDLTYWQFISTETMGVAGRDLLGERIGEYPAEWVANWNNWYPLDEYKQTLSGKLSRFSVYDGSGAEMDWNNFIIPSPAFEYIIEDAKSFEHTGLDVPLTENEWHDCEHGYDNCLEAEITPDEGTDDEDFWENEFFTISSETSPREGKTICTYGPWVREWKHDNRPEIHPSELFWWRNEGPGTKYVLMLLQDDSKRFYKNSNFDFSWFIGFDFGPESWWRPWAKPPKAAEFKIAFELRPGKPQRIVNIDKLYSRNLVTGGGGLLQDADDGWEHALEYNGDILLKVIEPLALDEQLGVTFNDVCRRSDGTLQGFMAIRSMVGRNADGDEGYLVLSVIDTTYIEKPKSLTVTLEKVRVIDTQPPGIVRPRPVVMEQSLRSHPKILLRARGLPHSLRRIISDGQSQLVADFRITFKAAADAKSEDFATTKVEFSGGHQRRDLVFIPDPQEKKGLVQGVPLAGMGVIRFYMKSGAVIRLNVNGLTLVPSIATEKPVLSELQPSAWLYFANAAGGGRTQTLPPLQMVNVKQWQLDAEPTYVALKTGEISPEEDSPFVEELNKIIKMGDTARIKELFGSRKPFTIEWSFQATNLTSREQVPVRFGEGPVTGGIHVKLLQGVAQNSRIEVTFPEQPTNAIYELIVTAKITDTFGNTNEIQYPLWSHILSGFTESGQVDNVLSVVATLAGVSAHDLLTISKIKIGPYDERTRNDPQARRARMVRLHAKQVAEDQRISLGELRSLIRAARLFGSK